MMDLSKHFSDYILRISRIASHSPDKDAVSATMLPTHDTVRLLEQVLRAHLGTIGINLLLNLFSTWTPLILKLLIKTQRVDIFGPPLSPARQVKLFRICWKVGLIYLYST